MQRTPVSTALTAAAVFVLPLSASGQTVHTESMTEPVIVTATRFPEPATNVIGRVVTITREEIAASGALTVPDVLRSVTGLQVRGLYGGLSNDTAVDMRGFGEGGAQRVLVLLNGRRLNPLDSASVDWSQVPLNRIERIEIRHGSGSILYGDNAVGGVINIITSTDTSGGSVAAGYGSFDTRELSVDFGGRSGALGFALSADHRASRGWRDNNSQEQNALGANFDYALEHGELTLEIGGAKTRFGLPGALTRAQYDDDPRQAETEDSFARRESTFLRPGLRYDLSDSLELAAELGLGETRSQSYISNFVSFQDRDTRTLSFTPRLKWRHGLGGLESTTVFGFDHYDGRLNADSAPAPSAPTTNRVRIDQESTAFYVQNHTLLTEALTVSLGARRQSVDQSARDRLGNRRDNDHSETIWEAGASWRVADGVRLFTRFGETFRFANLDELTTFGGFVSQPVRPEVGDFVDLGVEFSGQRYRVGATAYNLDMTDEISFNPMTFENENLARSRHRGLNVDGHVDLSSAWRLAGGVAWQKAEFRAGDNRGKRLPLVPEWSANASLTWSGVSGWNVTGSANHVGKRHFGGDSGNEFRRLPSHTIYDLVVARQIDAWTLRARALNLTDREYAPTGFNFGFGESFYPADGRTIMFDARLAF
jgi:iron complex outermembrane receptor protein